MDKVSVSAPPSHAPFHVTIANHSIYKSVLCPGSSFSLVLTLCRQDPVEAGLPVRGTDAVMGTTTSPSRPMHRPRLSLASLSHGHQPFFTLFEMHKNTLSNLTKRLSNYKILFVISYVISFQSCPVFFLFECIFSAGRFVGTQ